MKTNRKGFKVFVAVVLMSLSVLLSACGNGRNDACDLGGKNTAVTTCLYGALTGK